MLAAALSLEINCVNSFIIDGMWKVGLKLYASTLYSSIIKQQLNY